MTSLELNSTKLACLHELLDALDREIVDERRFALLKKILLVAATESRSARNDSLPHQFMQLARKLQTGEILTLFATYRIYKEGTWKQEKHWAANKWCTEVATEAGLEFAELAAIHEEKLMELQLITNREHADRSGVMIGDGFRLTELGIRFCEYVSEYDTISGIDD